jgi:hypothetical protein
MLLMMLIGVTSADDVTGAIYNWGYSGSTLGLLVPGSWKSPTYDSSFSSYDADLAAI